MIWESGTSTNLGLPYFLLGQANLYDKVGKEKHNTNKMSIPYYMKRRQYFGCKESQHIYFVFWLFFFKESSHFFIKGR